MPALPILADVAPWNNLDTFGVGAILGGIALCIAFSLGGYRLIRRWTRTKPPESR